MYQKSIIQQERERQDRIGMFKKWMTDLESRYEIQEAIFAAGNRPHEVVEGFLDVRREFSSIQDALSSISSDDFGMYVVSPTQVITGEICRTLNECQGNVAIDASTLKRIVL